LTLRLFELTYAFRIFLTCVFKSIFYSCVRNYIESGDYFWENSNFSNLGTLVTYFLSVSLTINLSLFLFCLKNAHYSFPFNDGILKFIFVIFVFLEISLFSILSCWIPVPPARV
jgi:hypothetical protein